MSRFKQIGSTYASMIAQNVLAERARRDQQRLEAQAMAAVESRIILDALALELTPEKIEAMMMEDRSIRKTVHYRIPLPDGIDVSFATAVHDSTFGSYASEDDFKKLCEIAGSHKLLAILKEMTDNEFAFYIDKDDEGKRFFLFWYFGH